MQWGLDDQVDYFGFLQLGSFYVLLGISSDYVFLYFDAYMQSLVEPLVAATLATRISYMCQRATPVRPLPAMLGTPHIRIEAEETFATEPLCVGDTFGDSLLLLTHAFPEHRPQHAVLFHPVRR